MDTIKLISVNNDGLKNEALNIYLKNDKQKQGLGTKIFRYLEKSFKNKKFLKIRIGVLVDNEIGLSFWKKQNFKEIERKFLKFEKSEKEIIVMEKEI